MADVVVLTGGSTPERDVALAGAGQVARALRARSHRVTVADTCQGVLDESVEASLLGRTVGSAPPTLQELERLRRDEDLPMLLRDPRIRAADLVFLVLHGRQGEGGSVQALLELEGLRFTGSDAVASGVAMDKQLSKTLVRAAGVSVPRGLLHRADRPVDLAAVEGLGLPFVVKPSRVGSTVGLTLVGGVVGSSDSVESQLDRALGLALSYDDEVLLEEFIAGRELTVGVLESLATDSCGSEPQALAVGEIIVAGQVFDYETKYTVGLAREIFPADIPASLADQLRRDALEVHRALKLRHYSRVDFRLRGDIEGRQPEPVCLEANTLPGMTKTSLLPQSAQAAGLDFDELCNRIVDLALS